MPSSGLTKEQEQQLREISSYDNVKKLIDESPQNINELFQNNEPLLPLVVTFGEVRTVELLLKKGANPDLPTIDGFTPLALASGQNNIEKVNLLLEYKANINLYYGDKLAPLMVAISCNHIEIAKLLIKHKNIDVNAQAFKGYNSLMLAINNERYLNKDENGILKETGISNFLIENTNIDLNYKNPQNSETALTLAFKKDLYSVVNNLFKYGVSANDLPELIITEYTWKQKFVLFFTPKVVKETFEAFYNLVVPTEEDEYYSKLVEILRTSKNDPLPKKYISKNLNLDDQKNLFEEFSHYPINLQLIYDKIKSVYPNEDVENPSSFLADTKNIVHDLLHQGLGFFYFQKITSKFTPENKSEIILPIEIFKMIGDYCGYNNRYVKVINSDDDIELIGEDYFSSDSE